MKTVKCVFLLFLVVFAIAALAGHPVISPEHIAAIGMIPMAFGDTRIMELRDQRGKLIADARAIVDKADAEKRALTAEEDAKYTEIFGKAEETRARIEREEKLIEAERSVAAQAARGGEGGQGGQPAAGAQGSGQGGQGDRYRTHPRGTDQYRAAWARFCSGSTDPEVRALQADSDGAGGFATASMQFVDQLIKNVDDQVFIRQMATKFRVDTAAAMGAPSLDADPADSDWTSELATGSEDGTMSFGKRELHPRPLAKRIKVSNKLLRLYPGAESLVMSRLGYKFGITQEKAFMTGTGANQPLGVFVAHNAGIPTTRDVSAGNSATTPTFDGLMGAKYGLKGQYWNKAEWIFHRDVLLAIAKLKDGEGQYIWRESVRAGEPDRLLNLPISMSEYAPNTMTTGLYVGILGDFSNYWIADAVDMQVQRLIELYAEQNQIGFIGRLETDGMPVLAEAFVRVKLG
jgi:HK97 family phage major capsid protein